MEFEDAADALAAAASGERDEAKREAEEGPGECPEESQNQHEHWQIDSPWLKDNNTRLL